MGKITFWLPTFLYELRRHCETVFGYKHYPLQYYEGKEGTKEGTKERRQCSDTKLTAYVFGCEKVALSLHICGTRKDKMEQSEKICFTGFEFYPALSHEDERTPDQKRGRLNTYGGLDIPPHFAIDWWKNLTPEQRAQAEKDLKFLEDDLSLL